MKRHIAIRSIFALAISGIGAVGAANAQSTCSVGETAVPFGFTGAEQTSVVPPGVTSLKVYLFGAQGGAGIAGAGFTGPTSPGGAGGLGGAVAGTLAVTPGQTLSIWVGGQGSQAVNPGGLGGVGASNSTPAGTGGGATDIRVGGNAIANRVAIAGGGGGGGNAGWGNNAVEAGGDGGAGGGGAGSAGVDVPGGSGPFGGSGGTVGVGGAGGGGCGSFPAIPGADSGDGGGSYIFSGSFSGAGNAGGGGGGSTNGGGGGGSGVGTITCQQNWNGGGGGGAGGASNNAGLTDVAVTDGVQTGDGAALVCYAQPIPTLTLASSANPSAPAANVTFTATLADNAPLTGTGNVTFCADATTTDATCGGTAPLCTVAAATPSIDCATTALAAGTHQITAYFSGDTNNGAATSAAPLTQLVGTAPAFTSAPATTFTIGMPGSFTVTSTGAPAPAISETGALPSGITFADNGDGTAALSGTPAAGIGTYALTIDATNIIAPDATQAFTLTVNQASQTTLAATPAPVYGQNVVLTATIGVAETGATGTVAFTDGGAPLAGCDAVSIASETPTTYTAICQSAVLAVGVHGIAAAYSGDALTLGSASALLSVEIAKANTTTALTQPAPITLGQSAVITASIAVVSPGAGSPSGTITVSDGGAGAGDTCQIAIASGASSGACSLTPTSAGTKPLSATFAPDAASSASFNGSSAPSGTTLQVDPAPAGAALASSGSPSAFGQNVTFTATVTPQAGNPTPTGTVVFSADGATICSAQGQPLAGSGVASATCAVSALAVGNHAIGAAYSGDSNNRPATATLAGGQTVNAAATTTTITPPAPVDLGASVLVHVTVAVQSPGSGTPSGSVTIADGAATCAATLDASGAGSCSLTPPAPAGTHSLSAAYAGTQNFAASTGTASLTVNAGSAGTVLTSSSNPSVFGDSITLTATVTPQPGNPAPTGTVDFLDGGTAIADCTGVALSGGSAACTTSTLSVGSHAMQANYSGDSNTSASTGTLTQVVAQATTAMTLIAAPNPADVGQTVTLTATVTATTQGNASHHAAALAAVPTGAVTFYDGAAPIGSGTLDANGIATLGIASFDAGVHSLSAVYAGNDAFAQATASATVTVNGAVTPARAVPTLSWWMLVLLAASTLLVVRRRYIGR